MNKDDYLNFTKSVKITKDEFKKVARMVALAYPPKTINDIPFLDSEDTFNLWFELLEDVSYLPVYLGMVDYIRENKYPPTLADIISYSKEKSRQLYQMDQQMEYNLHIVEETMHDYGHPNFSINGNNYYLFLESVLKDDLSKTTFSVNRFTGFVRYKLEKATDDFIVPENIEGWLKLWQKVKQD